MSGFSLVLERNLIIINSIWHAAVNLKPLFVAVSPLNQISFIFVLGTPLSVNF